MKITNEESLPTRKTYLGAAPAGGTMWRSGTVLYYVRSIGGIVATDIANVSSLPPAHPLRLAAAVWAELELADKKAELENAVAAAYDELDAARDAFDSVGQALDSLNDALACLPDGAGNRVALAKEEVELLYAEADAHRSECERKLDAANLALRDAGK